MTFESAARIAPLVFFLGTPALSQEPLSAPQPVERIYCADPGLCLHAPDSPQISAALAFGPGSDDIGRKAAIVTAAAGAMPGRSTAQTPPPTQTAPTQTAAPNQNAPASQIAPPRQSVPSIQTVPSAQTASPNPAGSPTLTLRDAEQLALKNHPRITVAQLNAMAYKQIYREVRSAFFPTIASDTTGVEADPDAGRITAGALNSARILNKAASGLVADQLITDFGRTKNLAASANLNAQSQQQNVVATREQIVLALDQAFYNALSTDVLVKVAEETVQARQVLVNQIQALENAKLRSALDLSFANVSLAQAQLLLVDATNNRDAAYATLSEVLGLPNQQPFTLVEPAPQVPPAQDINTIIQQALDNRPDLKALELAQGADEHFATAEERLSLPTVNALGAAGWTPVKSDLLTSNGYGAVGVNINIPIFNGFLFTARAQEAKLQAQAAAQRVRDLRDTVTHDVRVAWLNMNSAFERESVAAQLLQQATLGLNLAQSRYNLGLSSIVELTQAQLQQVEAEISTVTAKYDYEFAISSLEFQTGAITH